MSSRPAPILRRGSVFGRDDRSLRLDPVTFETEDGHTWDGLVYEPRTGPPARRRTAVLVVHGSVGNYLSGLPRRLSFALAHAGFPVLAVNTRMANYGVFFGGGLLHRTPLDLDGALGLLRRRGHPRVVMAGFSLGATMVVHYQALRRPAGVVGLATMAHPLSLPASLRRRWERHGARPTYEEVEARARALLGPDPDGGEEDEIFLVQRAAGPTEEPRDAEIWTYRTWWFSRGPEADHAVSARRVGQVDVPLLVAQAGADALVGPSEGEELRLLARAGSCPAVRLETLAGADHVFSGRVDELATLCAAWMDEL